LLFIILIYRNSLTALNNGRSSDFTISKIKMMFNPVHLMVFNLAGLRRLMTIHI